MDLHKPKPIRNWREFLKEYAIIVLGVVTALAGEELAVTIHHHSEVVALRSALHTELAWNLATMKEAADDSPCVEQRLAELENWKRALQSGSPQSPKIAIPRPGYRIFRTSTWRSAAGATLDNFPLDERIAYAQFYDGVDNNAIIRNDAVSAWADLNDFEDAHALNAQEARQVTHDIKKIRDGYRRLVSNYNNVWKARYAPAVGLGTEDTPLQGRYQRVEVDAERATLCKPIVGK